MKKRKPVDPSTEDEVNADAQEAETLPARGAKKPNADEQDGDWAGDRDYE